MSDNTKPGMGFEVNIRSKSSQSRKVEINPDSPMNIAVMGDFSGKTSQSRKTPIGKRRFVKIDRDNIEEVMASLNISLNLIMDGKNVQLKINEFDDFHPDELYEKVETFSQLRSLRRRLKNNNTFQEAASEIQSWLPEKEMTSSIEKQPVVEKTTASGNLLDDILDSQSNQTPDASSYETAQIDKLIKSIVAPYVEPSADPRQDEMIEIVDKATQRHMRDILHNDEFQAIESAWRSLYFLVTRIETGSSLKIMLLDINKEELQQDVALDDISQSSVYKKFCDPSEGDEPWGLLIGNYTFTDTIDDILSLANIASIAEQSSAPFISSASETFVGCESFASTPDYEDWNREMSEGVSEAWSLVRNSPSASYIGLALPRFLLRLPYGKKSKPVDAFKFEEMPEGHCHECYLWGNAAFIKAEMIARNFNQHAWEMNPQEVYQTDGLPMAYYSEDGETVTKPVAEIYLTERGGEIINKHGLITLWSVRNSDTIKSADYRSISESTDNISGRWSW